MNSRYLILLLVFFSSCYSFTGSSLDPRIKTIKISRFNNYSAFQLPNYAQTFTDDLQLRFDQRSQLSLTNSNDADIILEGEIIDMYETPVNIGSGDQANENRLTVKVRVNYINNVQEEKSFVKTFSSYIDFEATQTLNQVAPSILPEVNTLLIDQIFTAIVADW